jgi:hypothetical protein
MNKKERKEYLKNLPSRTMTDEEWEKHAEKDNYEKECEGLLKESNMDESKYEPCKAVKTLDRIIKLLE